MKEFLKAINKLAMECVVKVLQIDLNTGNYTIIHLDKGEDTCSSPVLDDWVKESINSGLIHPDYSDAVSHIISTEYIKNTLKYKKYIHLKFKRMPYKNMTYRMNVATILPCEENKAYIIIYDIEE